MLKKLRKQIILIELAAFFLVTLVIVATININSHQQMVKNAHQLLLYLADHDGDIGNYQDSTTRKKIADYDIGFNSHMTEETQYTTRYFFATIDKSGEIKSYNLDHIAAISDDEVESYVSRAMEKSADESNLSNYRYLRVTSKNETTIYFVDYSVQKNYTQYIMNMSLIVGGICMAFVLLIVYLLSGIVMRPIAENYELQRRFITDASHELKTPIAAISANVDVLELVSGENEVTGKIKKQVRQLGNLVNEMLTLSRMDDVKPVKECKTIDLTELVKNEASDFTVIAEQRGVNIVTNMDSKVKVYASEKDMERLVSVLLDNAVKYCTEAGEIQIKVSADMHFARFSIVNSSEPISTEEIGHLFDRFYRTDSSRSRETGSYGIGLSIAQAIVTRYHGKINVKNVAEGVSFEFVLPKIKG